MATRATHAGRPSSRFVPFLLMACVFAMVCCAFALAAPTVALARDYSISAVNIDATVGSDGTLSVTEDRTYVFDGSFHGVYWDIPVSTYSGRSVSVAVQSAGIVSGGSYSEFDYSRSQTSGSFTYEETTNDNGTDVERVTLYSTQSDSTVTFRIAYSLAGGVSAWADTGELYWKFVSDGWDVPSNNVTCTIHLPAPSGTTISTGESGNVRAWAHGPLNGEVSITSSGVTLTVPEVGTSEFAEARVVFPVSWLSGMTPSSTSELSTIESEEQGWADEANAKRRQAQVLVFGSAGVIGLASVGSILKLIKTKKRYKEAHTPTFTGDYFRDVPSNDHPSVLGAMMRDGKAAPEDFTAALMRLTDEHAIGLDLVTTTRHGIFGDKQDKDYRLTRNPSVAQRLTNPVDVATMHFLFDVVASRVTGYEPASDGKDTLLFSDVSKVAKDHAETYSESMDDWKNKVSAACKQRGFFTDKSDSGQVGLGVLGGADIVIGIVAIVFLGLIMGLGGFVMIAGLALIVVGIVMCASAASMDSLSSEAVELRAKMNALKRWLCEFTRLKEAVPQDVILWNKLLVLAVVLGVADQVIRQLKVAMPELLENPEFLPTYGWYMGYGGMPAPADTFTQAYNSAAQVSMAQLASSTMSSGGGFGGGFSGGGGGGFGGGGGGGAF